MKSKKQHILEMQCHSRNYSRQFHDVYGSWHEDCTCEHWKKISHNGNTCQTAFTKSRNLFCFCCSSGPSTITAHRYQRKTEGYTDPEVLKSYHKAREEAWVTDVERKHAQQHLNVELLRRSYSTTSSGAYKALTWMDDRRYPSEESAPKSSTIPSTMPSCRAVRYLDDENLVWCYGIETLEKKRKRSCFDGSQVDELEKYFEKKQYVGMDERIELAAKLNLEESRIKIWFQNRRAKQKRMQTKKRIPSTSIQHEDIDVEN